LKTIRNCSPFLFLLLLWPTHVKAQVVTNEQVVVRAARIGVENNFKSPKFEIVSIEVLEDEISRPIAIGLSEGFENLGVNVVGNDRVVNSVQNVELRKRMLRRKFMAILKLTFSNRQNKSISEIRDITISYEDQIDPELADLVKSRKIPALDPPFPSTGLKKVVEPVVVTAAVGVLVYLFFANR